MLTAGTYVSAFRMLWINRSLTFARCLLIVSFSAMQQLHLVDLSLVLTMESRILGFTGIIKYLYEIYVE